MHRAVLGVNGEWVLRVTKLRAVTEWGLVAESIE
jgi:hypothetical protein